ncbi:MAG TPA: sigma-70 family RNA polymerase sigma factor [Gillisia sp.]|nr:sigma-70 family RNA polymerase sigma factor [Gillisia sp.]
MKTENIWSLFSKDLYHFILSKVKDKELAWDVLQEVFVKVHLKKESLKEGEALKSWLFTLARNTVTDHYRKNKSSNEFSIDLSVNTPEDSTRHSPNDCLIPIIKKLPEIYRDALILDIQGKKQEEIAREFNISLSGAKSRVQRGRKLLQQGFVECCNYIIKNGVLVGETRPKKECRVCDEFSIFSRLPGT